MKRFMYLICIYLAVAFFITGAQAQDVGYIGIYWDPSTESSTCSVYFSENEANPGEWFTVQTRCYVFIRPGIIGAARVAFALDFSDCQYISHEVWVDEDAWGCHPTIFELSGMDVIISTCECSPIEWMWIATIAVNILSMELSPPMSIRLMPHSEEGYMMWGCDVSQTTYNALATNYCWINQPCQEIVATKNISWGAIKSMYK